MCNIIIKCSKQNCNKQVHTGVPQKSHPRVSRTEQNLTLAAQNTLTREVSDPFQVDSSTWKSLMPLQQWSVPSQKSQGSRGVQSIHGRSSGFKEEFIF